VLGVQSKQLDEALAHYNKAIELDPKARPGARTLAALSHHPTQEISFFTNRAAVLFEQSKYEECIRVRDRSAASLFPHLLSPGLRHCR